MRAAYFFNSVVHLISRRDLMRQPDFRRLAIILVLILNDYFSCAKNNGSLKSNRKLVTVTTFSKYQKR